MLDFRKQELAVGDTVALFWCDGQLAEGVIVQIRGNWAKLDVTYHGSVSRSKWKAGYTMVKLEAK